MSANATVLIFALYLAMVGFGIWLACTLVFAVVRISRALESAGRCLEEITKAYVDRNGTPGR
jgi:hypothetical protein